MANKLKNITKKSTLRKYIKSKGYRINNEMLNEIDLRLCSLTLDLIESVERKAMLSGRKTIKKSDLE